MHRSARQPGFTLIELLVVVSIIGILIVLLMPALGGAQASARETLCLSNQKQTTTALLNYTTENKGRLMDYALRLDTAGNVRWWFGQGTDSGDNRPLDKTKGPLAHYLGENIHDGLACPAFPADDPAFVAKFSVRSAHFGYNGAIHWPQHALSMATALRKPPRQLHKFDQPSDVFAFADALHQDFRDEEFYEPHTVAYRKSGGVSGAAHFRHNRRANIALLDGHAEAIQPPQGEQAWASFGGADLVNVDTADGQGTRYGFETWTAQLR